MPSLAKRLVEPDYWTGPGSPTGPAYVETFGPEVADLCERIGFAPDPQQELALDAIFAIQDDGLSACFGFTCIACRQNIKTGLFKQAAIGWLFVIEVPLIVWSAHELDTSAEAHLDLQNLILESPSLSRRLPLTPNRGIYDANGQMRIELADGRRIKFKARTRTGGRGLAAPKVILDEGFALRPFHLGTLLPAMGAQPDPQVLIGSSAGMTDSDVLLEERDLGRKGVIPRQVYMEWLARRRPCATPDCPHPKFAASMSDPVFDGCALNDHDLWVEANFAITTGRMSIETIQGLRNKLTAEEFMRECLGWWDEEDDRPWVIAKAHYNACYDTTSAIASAPTFALDVSPEREFAAIGVAGIRPDGDAHVEITSRGGVVDHRPGVEWVVPRLKQLRVNFPAMRLKIAKDSGAKPLVPAIEKAGIPVDVIPPEEVPTACGYFHDQMVGHHVWHRDQPQLREALKAAAKMPVGDGQFRWSRLKSDEDITCLYAETLALWKSAGSPDPEFSMFTAADLDSCDRCGQPAGDGAADRGYLCEACWAETEEG